MMQVTVSLLAALLLVLDVDAQIPLPCATLESLEARTCCPVPDPETFPYAGPCGVHLGRGFCKEIAIPDSEFDPERGDVRWKWPIQYFNSTCVCNKRYGGVDCRECSYAYNDGTTECVTKTIRPRTSVGDMTEAEWTNYREALGKIKRNPSRYMVVTVNFTTDLQSLIDSMVRPSSYDLFVWLHHIASKDDELTLNTNRFLEFAHEGPGFPTWHRLFLIWMEREIQIEISDHLFRLPYWDWRDPMQREILFRRDRLGENVDGNVVGDLFGANWPTFCWEDISGKEAPLPICNPTIPSGQNLRRCPIAYLCNQDNEYWPSYEDVAEAISIKQYDSSPYDRFVVNTEKSFRNYLEGFITKPGLDCGNDTMCTADPMRGVTVKRILHNTGHIIPGIGDLQLGPSLPFERTGVLASVASSANDPVFLNHHAMVDCILEQWLQRHKHRLNYPISDEIREGHRERDYIVPFIPLYMNIDVFKTSDNFGYFCSLP